MKTMIYYRWWHSSHRYFRSAVLFVLATCLFPCWCTVFYISWDVVVKCIGWSGSCFSTVLPQGFSRAHNNASLDVMSVNVLQRQFAVNVASGCIVCIVPTPLLPLWNMFFCIIQPLLVLSDRRFRNIRLFFFFYPWHDDSQKKQQFWSFSLQYRNHIYWGTETDQKPERHSEKLYNTEFNKPKMLKADEGSVHIFLYDWWL